MTENLSDSTRLLAGRTIWNVAEWIETQLAHYGGESYEIFPSPPTQQDLNANEKYGYRITVRRIPRHPDPFGPQPAHEKIKKALVALDDHFLGVNQHARRELQAFLAAYDIPWNNPA